VDAIAAEAGVSKMTIYSHFASKEGLFEAVLRDRAVRIVGGIAGVEALDPKQPRKALLAIGAQFLTLAREDEAWARSARSTAPPGLSPRFAGRSTARGPTG
jgi:TetR/AcrR family transcriptional repressor of mexJK operon